MTQTKAKWGMIDSKLIVPTVDANANGIVRYSGAGNDPAAVFTAIGTTVYNGYYLVDVNMNGVARYSGPSNEPASIFNYVGSTPVATQVPS